MYSELEVFLPFEAFGGGFPNHGTNASPTPRAQPLRRSFEAVPTYRHMREPSPCIEDLRSLCRDFRKFHGDLRLSFDDPGLEKNRTHDLFADGLRNVMLKVKPVPGSEVLLWLGACEEMVRTGKDVVI
jgi:hypothetical protein